VCIHLLATATVLDFNESVMIYECIMRVHAICFRFN
jgi:hypothetical protein